MKGVNGTSLILVVIGANVLADQLGVGYKLAWIGVLWKNFFAFRARTREVCLCES